MKTLIAFSLFVATFIGQFFFGISGLFGYEYTGIEEGATYVLYVFSVFTVTTGIYLYATLKKGIRKGELAFFALVGAILLIHLLWNALAPSRSVMFPNQLFLFFSIGLVGAFAGLSTVKLELLPNMRKLTDVVALIFSVSVFVFAILPFLGGIRLVSIGGASYQFFSYFSAITFGLLVYANYIQPNNERFAVFNSPVYAIVAHVLMVFAILGVLLGGGRGAFVVLVAYACIGIAVLFRVERLTLKKVLERSAKFIFLFLAIAAFLYFFADDQFVQRGFNRAIAYIDGTGINLAEGSSGRDFVYAVAWNALWEQPVIGYGPFNVQELVVRPHNLFFDMFLQFGLLIGGLVLLTLGWIVLKQFSQRSVDTAFVLHLGVYPVIMLQVSGSYLVSSVFWFVLAVLMVKTFENDRCRKIKAT